ncbi:hypothetical protein [Roseateles sp. L2-2]|uniref:hypothetical protein n=1 Tax=Roseateles sp. L2-2 TaxID=3422597 RepID=UPI003D35ADF0
MTEALQNEISRRLSLIEDLRKVLVDIPDRGAPQLQPVFGLHLWLLDPQLDSIEFVPNLLIAGAVADLHASLVPDRSVGFYSCAASDPDLDQNGIDQLIVVVLTRPGVKAGAKERLVVWNSAKRLRELKLIGRDTRVMGYLVGERFEGCEDQKMGNASFATTQPLFYGPMLDRAESRLIHLAWRTRQKQIMAFA